MRIGNAFNRVLRSLPILCMAALACLHPAAASAVPFEDSAWPAAIEDNSFLIEEAYNQEPGVIQHIFTAWKPQGSREVQWSFTEEWPAAGQAHQISLTVPYLDRTGTRSSGVGDILVNYRYQWMTQDHDLVTAAPRLSLVLPVGDKREDLGFGATGLQFNLPVSWRLSSRWITHFNAGSTWWGNAYHADFTETDQWSFNEGVSAILLLHPNVNLLLELVALQTTYNGPGGDVWERQAFISPGIRGALNFGRLQVVGGLAFPFGMTSASSDRSVLLYLSIEHPAWDLAP